MKLRDDKGFTLVELLVVMTVSLVVLTATLVTFDGLYRTARDTDRRADTAEVARVSLDKAARQLRNLAKRLNNDDVIYKATPDDFIFQTSDPSRTWVRYCLDTTGPGSSPSRARLWTGQLSVAAGVAGSAVTAGMAASCPGSGWTRTEVAADYVVNRVNGLTRPVFSYQCLDGTAGCTASATTYDKIVNVNAQLVVDTTPLKGPKELLVATGVHMRNQNQPPIAMFDSTRLPTPARTVQLNASGSTDYEGRTLQYYWFKTTLPTSIRCDQATASTDGSGNKTMWGGRLLGDGVTLTDTFPASDGGSVLIGLVVCDPGDLYSSVNRTVVIQ